MDKTEKVDMVREAQEKIYEAIELLNEAVGDNTHTRAYLIEQLQILAGEGHGFLSNDLNCDKVIEGLENACDKCGFEDCEGECEDEEVNKNEQRKNV